MYKLSTNEVQVDKGYTMGFSIADPYTITFSVLTEMDPTLVDQTRTCVGTYYSTRDGEEESLEDFANRAYAEGFTFAKVAIVDYKQALRLNEVLGGIVDSSE